MRYTATATVTLGPGAIIGLSQKQAARRAHLLEPTHREGVFTAKAAVQFKAGEEFDYEGELPKNLVDIVVDAKALTKARAKADTEARAEAKAEAGTKAKLAATEKQMADMAGQLKLAQQALVEAGHQLAAAEARATAAEQSLAEANAAKA
jgi:hypothetical protein